ncbi:hypothetical protein CapIbe_001954 [Capra ibex]
MAPGSEHTPPPAGPHPALRSTTHQQRPPPRATALVITRLLPPLWRARQLPPTPDRPLTAHVAFHLPVNSSCRYLHIAGGLGEERTLQPPWTSVSKAAPLTPDTEGTILRRTGTRWSVETTAVPSTVHRSIGELPLVLQDTSACSFRQTCVGSL